MCHMSRRLSLFAFAVHNTQVKLRSHKSDILKRIWPERRLLAAAAAGSFYVLLENRQYLGWFGHVVNYSSVANILVMEC